MTNAELEQKVNEIETLLDDIIVGLNAVPSSATLNAAVLNIQTQLNTLNTTLTSVQASLVTLQNIVNGL